MTVHRRPRNKPAIAAAICALATLAHDYRGVILARADRNTAGAVAYLSADMLAQTCPLLPDAKRRAACVAVWDLALEAGK
jgi:hypothetical protein